MATLRRLLERRATPLPKRAQAIVVGVTGISLLVAAGWAWRSTDLTLATVTWWPIAVAFLVISPVTLGAKMLEYDAASRIVGARAPWRRAFDVSIVSAAANLLPLPGSVIVTTQAISEQGASYGSAVVASTIPGLAWLGLSGLVGGTAIAVAGGAVVGMLIASAGAVVSAAAVVAFRRTAVGDGRMAIAVRIVLIEVAWIGLSGLRFWLLLRTLDVDASPAQVLALAVAGAMTVAIGFVPGGLGVREALIAALSPIISLPVADGLLLGVIDRVVWLSFLALAAVVAAATRGRSAAGGRGEDGSEFVDEGGVGVVLGEDGTTGGGDGPAGLPA
ncbi:MAG: lysylphosphatidylglycerol synthase domain-containing protein [Actinomycetota bacterium]